MRVLISLIPSAAIAAALLVTAPAEAACISAPRTGTKLYDECKLRKLQPIPGPATVAAFPKGADPTFRVLIEFLPAVPQIAR